VLETILLVDDDKTLLELLSSHVEAAGYQAIVASKGEDAVQLAMEKRPSLLVLDVMMPGMDGWEVCRCLRRTSSIPIIMLTAKGEEFDKLRGFHLGVDDYVTKPFSFAELNARIKAVLARTKGSAGMINQLQSGDVTIDFHEHKITVQGKIVELSPTEYRLLEALAQHAHKTVPSEKLVTEVWGPEYAGETEHIKRYIWALRKKIERDPGDPHHILTERGYGYRFE